MAALEAALGSGRPVMLATLHYGNLTELYHWLRSRGLAVAFIVARDLNRRTEYRNHVDSLADQANGLVGVPRLFQIDQLWEAREFLSEPRRLLVIPMDGSARPDIRVQGADYELEVATGALRLAAIAGAMVLPCLSFAPSALRFTIAFGNPVPIQNVPGRRKQTAACEDIVGQLLPWVEQRPEHCAPILMWALHATPKSSEKPHPG
jgi:hypothetical protein